MECEDDYLVAEEEGRLSGVNLAFGSLVAFDLLITYYKLYI